VKAIFIGYDKHSRSGLLSINGKIQRVTVRDRGLFLDLSRITLAGPYVATVNKRTAAVTGLMPVSIAAKYREEREASQRLARATQPAFVPARTTLNPQEVLAL
jgi:hypothetical protein